VTDNPSKWGNYVTADSWCVASSALATNVSPVWKLDTVPPASTVTAVWAGQKLSGRQRSCVGREAEDRNEEAKEALRQKELREAEERARSAELQAAKDRQEAAEKLAAAETAAKEEAQAHAVLLRKRSRVLRAVLAATAIVAIIAVVGFGLAFYSRHQANARFSEATAFRLTTDAALALPKNPSDAQAIQELLAARALVLQP
jgi:hypothetical protein